MRYAIKSECKRNKQAFGSLHWHTSHWYVFVAALCARWSNTTPTANILSYTQTHTYANRKIIKQRIPGIPLLATVCEICADFFLSFGFGFSVLLVHVAGVRDVGSWLHIVLNKKKQTIQKEIRKNLIFRCSLREMMEGKKNQRKSVKRNCAKEMVVKNIRIISLKQWINLKNTNSKFSCETNIKLIFPFRGVNRSFIGNVFFFFFFLVALQS